MVRHIDCLATDVNGAEQTGMISTYQVLQVKKNRREKINVVKMYFTRFSGKK